MFPNNLKGYAIFENKSYSENKYTIKIKVLAHPNTLNTTKRTSRGLLNAASPIINMPAKINEPTNIENIHLQIVPNTSQNLLGLNILLSEMYSIVLFIFLLFGNTLINPLATKRKGSNIMVNT